MSIKLIYFKMRALAEAPQMLMHYAGIEYEYLMSWVHFDDVWAHVKPTISYKQLPILIVDDQHEIAQSGSILRYIEQIAGLSVSDPVAAAQADAVLQSAQELFAPLNPAVNFATGADFEAKKEAMRPILLSRFDDLERAMARTDGVFFTGNTPRACDFAAYHHLDLSRKLDAELITGFPHLEQLVAEIEALPAISSYLDTRPELIDVSVEPKLVIDGVAHPTGVTQT